MSYPFYGQDEQARAREELIREMKQRAGALGLMTQPPLPIGSVVWLRSGSPAMVVAGWDGTKLFCKWFDGRELKDGGFDHRTLVGSDPAMTSKPVNVTVTKDGKVKPKKAYRDASQAIRERKSKKQRPIRRIV